MHLDLFYLTLFLDTASMGGTSLLLIIYVGIVNRVAFSYILL